MLNNLQAAIDLLETHQFDLIFTDLFMPKISGLELIKRVRTNKTLAKSNTHIIALCSPTTQSKALGIAMALNINDVIVKPLIPNIIGDKINRITSSPFQMQNPIAYEVINTEIVL